MGTTISSRPNSPFRPISREPSPCTALMREEHLPSSVGTPILKQLDRDLVALSAPKPSISDDKQPLEASPTLQDGSGPPKNTPPSKRIRLENSSGQRGGAVSVDMQANALADKDTVDEIYTQLFGSDLKAVHFEQQDIGDCYFLAALDAILNHREANRILRKIKIQKIPANGLDPLRYRVTFHQGQVVVNSEKIGRKRRGIQPVDGPEGVQLLESAYGKLIRPEQNKQRNAKLQKQTDSTEKPYPRNGRSRTPELMEGGNPQTALQQMLGGSTTEFNAAQSVPSGIKILPTKSLDQNPEIMEQLEIYLKDLEANSKRIYLLTANTPDDLPKDEADYDVIRLPKSDKPVSSQRKFYRDHSYSVRSFDRHKRTITVADPHDTKNKVHTLSFEEFCQVFKDLKGIELKESEL